MKLWKFDHSSNRSVGVETHSFLKWDLSNSVPKYLVKTSAQLSLVPIFRSLISPFPTNSCTYRNLSSTCLVFLLVPNLVAMLFPAVLSVWTVMLTDFANLASVIRLRMYSASLVPCPMAYSSASPELSAIVPCVLLPKETVEFRIWTTVPLVLFLVLLHPAQSEST